MGELIPLRPTGHATNDGDSGRWCSSCGTKRDASPSCRVCGATAWQSYPLTAAGSGSATFSANVNAATVNVTWHLT